MIFHNDAPNSHVLAFLEFLVNALLTTTHSRSQILTWLQRKLHNFWQPYWQGGNKQRLHGTTLQAEERKENQNDISVSRKFGCWCINKISSQINFVRLVYYFVCSNIELYTSNAYLALRLNSQQFLIARYSFETFHLYRELHTNYSVIHLSYIFLGTILPYKLPVYVWMDNSTQWPPLSFPDLYHYLIKTTGVYNQEKREN